MGPGSGFMDDNEQIHRLHIVGQYIKLNTASYGMAIKINRHVGHA